MIPGPYSKEGTMPIIASDTNLPPLNKKKTIQTFRLKKEHCATHRRIRVPGVHLAPYRPCQAWLGPRRGRWWHSAPVRRSLCAREYPTR